MTLRDAILAVAEACEGLGIHEEGGANRGEMVEKFLVHAGGAKGMPWCVAFGDWCYDTACEIVGVKPAFNVGLSSSMLVNKAKKLGRLVESAYDALPGYLVVFRGGPTGFKHTGVMVKGMASDHSFETIEGNQGDAVKRMNRWPIKTPCVFVRTD